MKDRYDRLAMIAIVLVIVARIGALIMGMFDCETGPSTTAGSSAYFLMSRAAVLPFALAVNIAIGIWLFREAKVEGRRPWVWMLFGFFFQLTAVAVFYLIRIHEELKQSRRG